MFETAGNSSLDIRHNDAVNRGVSIFRNKPKKNIVNVIPQLDNHSFLFIKDIFYM